MNKTHSTFTPLRAALLIGALAALPAFAAPTVSVSGPAQVLSGGTVVLDVSASGFTDLYAYQFDVNFNPALFSAVGVAPGAFLATAGATFFDGGLIDNAAGTVSFVIESLIGPGAGASGAGDLVQLVFGALGAGSSSGSFVLSNFVALDSALNAIDVDLQGAAVAIPEPSSLALAMAAVGAGLAATSKRARHATPAATVAA